MTTPTLLTALAPGMALPPAALLVAQATLVLALGFAVCLLLRRASAALRHRLWCVTFGGVLALPLLAVALPGWPVLPAPALAPAHDAGTPVSPTAGTPGMWAPGGQPEAATPSVRGDGAGTLHAPGDRRAIGSPTPPGAGTGSPAAHPPAGEAAAGSGPPPRSAPGAAAAGPVPVARAALRAGWLAGAASVLLWVGLGLLRLARLRRGARPVRDPRVRAELERQARRAGLAGYPILLLETDEPGAVPATWGAHVPGGRWSRPVILLPRGVAREAGPELGTVLLHELVHVRRGDWVLRFPALLACALLWFHPLAWLARHRLLEAEERAVDEAVVALGVPGREYAAHLLEVVRRLGSAARRLPTPAALTPARPSSLEGRIRNLLRPGGGQPRRESPRLRAAASLALALGVVGVAALEGARPEATAAPSDSAGARPALPFEALEPLAATPPAPGERTTRQQTADGPEATGATGDPPPEGVPPADAARADVWSPADTGPAGPSGPELRLARVVDGTELPGARAFTAVRDAAVLSDGRVAALVERAGGATLLVLDPQGAFVRETSLAELPGVSGRESLIPFGADGLAAGRPQDGLLHLHRVAGDGSLEPLGEIALPAGFEDVCWAEGRFYVVERRPGPGAARDDGAPGDPRRHIVRIVAEDGRTLGTLAPLPEGIEGLAQVPHRQARLACAAGPAAGASPLVVLQPVFFAEASAWWPPGVAGGQEEGVPAWRVRLPDFLPLEITGDRSQARYALPAGADAWHRVGAIVPAGAHHLLVQTELRRSPSSSAGTEAPPRDEVERAVLALELEAGRYTGAELAELPALLAGAAGRVVGVGPAGPSRPAALHLYDVIEP